MYLQKLLIIYGEEVEHIVLWSPNEQSLWSPNEQSLWSPNVQGLWSPNEEGLWSPNVQGVSKKMKKKIPIKNRF